MRKIFLLLTILTSFAAAAQTPFPLYIPSNPDSLKIPVNLNGATRTVYNIDLVKFRASLIAHDTATALRLLIPTNNNQLANGAGYIADTTPLHAQIATNNTAIGLKADKSTTISINGSSQTLGSNPSFTVSGGTSTDTTSLSTRINQKLNIADTAAIHNQIATNTTAIGLKNNVIPQFLNLSDYGGVGDSTTDNTTAFTNAVAALPAKGGIIYIGAGIYKVNSTVTVNKSVIFLGAGAGVFTLGYMASTTKILTTSSTIDVFDVTAANVQFKDLNIENTNNTTSPLPTAGSGIKFTTGNGFKLINVTINGFYNDLEIISAYHWLITGSTISGYVNYGIHIQDVAIPDAGDASISDCWIYPKGRNSVASIYQESGGGLKVANTKFNYDYNNGSTRYSTQYHYNSNFTGAITADLLFSNCSFENYTVAGIRLIPNASFSGNVAITGNQFGGAAQVVNDVYLQNVSGVSVMGNQFKAGVAGSAAVNLVSVSNYKVVNSYTGYTTPTVGVTAQLETGVLTYNNNSFGFAENFQNTNTGASAFSGVAFNNTGTSGAVKGQILYAPSNYTDATLQNTFLLSSVGTTSLGFVSDATNANHPDIYFKSGNSTRAIQVVGSTNFVGINSSTSNSNLQVSGSFSLPYVSKTAAYTITASDYTVDCNGTFTLTIPTAVGITGRIYVIKNSGTGTITLAGTSAQTFDGATSPTISTQYGLLRIQSNGANWIVL